MRCIYGGNLLCHRGGGGGAGGSLEKTKSGARDAEVVLFCQGRHGGRTEVRQEGNLRVRDGGRGKVDSVVMPLSA